MLPRYPTLSECSYLEPRYLEPRYLEPRYLEPRYLEPRYLEPQVASAASLEATQVRSPSFVQFRAWSRAAAERELGGT